MANAQTDYSVILKEHGNYSMEIFVDKEAYYKIVSLTLKNNAETTRKECTCEHNRQSGYDRIHCPVHGLELAGCTCHKNPLRDYSNRTTEEECPIHGNQ